MLVKVRILESVPFLSYLHFCNVLYIWSVRVIPNYRVYRLYGIRRSPSRSCTKRAFSYDWFKKYRWLEYSKRRMLLTVMHAEYFQYPLLERSQMHLRTLSSEIGSMPQDKMEVYLNMIVINKQCYLRTVFFCFKKD